VPLEGSLFVTVAGMVVELEVASVHVVVVAAAFEEN